MPDIPDTMRAVVLTGHGGLDKLTFRDDWPVPRPGPGEVLIKIGACGMNNTDVNTRSGWYSKSVTEATTGDAYTAQQDGDSTWGGAGVSFPRIQGADAVGTVVAVGDGADTSLIHRRVMVDCWLRDWSDPLNRDHTGYFGSERDGGYAEYTTADQRNVRAIDTPMTDAELATFSCSYTTAEGMLTRAGVTAQDTVLVTGASGGVGSALIQLAKRRGATVVGLASASKHADLAPLGADALLPRAPEDLAAALKSAIGRETVTVVADIVGGPAFGSLIDRLARGGHYTCSGAIAGPIVELDLRTFYLNDLTFHGSTVLTPEIFPALVGYIERGEIKPLLAATYPLEDFHAGQQAFIDKRHVGNIAVVP
ncbi:MAG: alcohol dehydrogenase family protein [Pseudomonadota bacterium]